MEKYAGYLCLEEWHRFQQALPPQMYTAFGFYCVAESLGRRGKISHITVDAADRAGVLLSRWERKHHEDAEKMQRGVVTGIKMEDPLPHERFTVASYAIAYFEELLDKQPFSFYEKNKPQKVDVLWTRVMTGNEE